MNPLLTSAVLVGLGIFLLGVPLHYLFDAVGRIPAAGLIGPVNESAWEHFKLFYWPLVLLGFVEFPVLRTRAASYFLPKFLSMLTAFALMAAFYYLPAALFGGSLVISIGAFAVGVLGAQTVFSVLASGRPKGNSEVVGAVAIFVLGLLFDLWTFLPPHLLPWLDVQGGFYGPRAH
jgi:hypothetical protein